MNESRVLLLVLYAGLVRYCAESFLKTIICAGGGGDEVLGAFNTGNFMGRGLQTVQNYI